MLYHKRPPPQKYIWTRPTRLKRRLLYVKKLTRREKKALLATAFIWTLVVWAALGLMLWQDGLAIWRWVNGETPVLAQPLARPTPFGPQPTTTVPPSPTATRVVQAPQLLPAPSTPVITPTATISTSTTSVPPPVGVTPLSTVPLPTPTLTASASLTVPRQIVIDAVGIDAPIIEVGWDVVEWEGKPTMVWEVADYAVGWHKNSALPGQPGNIVLSGHNNIAGEVFRSLDEISVGDKIVTYVGQQAFEYEVTFTTIVKEADEPLDVRKQNAHWIAPTDEERLTLVTCWPYPYSTHRFIVVAEPTQRLAASP